MSGRRDGRHSARHSSLPGITAAAGLEAAVYNHEINSAPSDTDERVIRTARGVNSRNDVTRASNMRQRRARTC